MNDNLKKIPIGEDDFKRLIENNNYYVDKTRLIEDILTRGSLVNLFPRPRRFGKTLTISMLDNYFNIKKKELNKNLFKGLEIEKSSKEIQKEKGKYPVISLNLKEIKAENWKLEFNLLKNIISKLYYDHIEVQEVLNETEKRDYNAILLKRADEAVYQLSLKNLSQYLMRLYKERVIILIDEYDAPIEKGYIEGFYDEVIDFMRNFFGAALKTNDALKFACITGILRVSKESIFSGLNNIDIYSILNEQYSEYFGFLPEEVDKILEDYGMKDRKEDIKKWYDGYNFGGTEIYNPWSILKAISRKEIDYYWTNTGGTDILEEILKKSSSIIKQELEQLLIGDVIKVKLDENIVYAEISGSRENIYNFMLMSGYLTVEKIEREGKYKIGYLKIPNLEVEVAFENMINRWFQEKTGREEIIKLQKALLEERKEIVEELLNSLMEKSMSYFDNAENFYHGFVLGLMVDMGKDYVVLSNRESGFGRYDMKIEKMDKSVGIILEFKTAKEDEKMEEEARNALEQINNNKYYLEMKEKGITNILKYGIAFNNKKAVVR